MALSTRPLHSKFGKIVTDVNLDEVNENYLYQEIRELFEKHSALLFCDQTFSEETHIKFAQLFGPLENRDAMATKKNIKFEIPKVSNEDGEGSVFDESDLKTLDLKGNMLWHTDSTFLPIPALANIIAAKVIPSSGGQTELTSTRVALRDLPIGIYKKIEGRKIWHSVAHSRSKIDKNLAQLEKISRWRPQSWNSIFTNPVTGEDSIYIASHSYEIEGYDKEVSQDLIDKIINFCTQEKYVYSHNWKKGDVLIWDERSTLHRGRPWPYSEPRTLNSICVSITEKDGLLKM